MPREKSLVSEKHHRRILLHYSGTMKGRKSKVKMPELHVSANIFKNKDR